MSDVTWRLFVNELIETFNKMQNDLDQIKHDMADFRQYTTDIIDMQYDLDKKLNQTISMLKDVLED